VGGRRNARTRVADRLLRGPLPDLQCRAIGGMLWMSRLGRVALGVQCYRGMNMTHEPYRTVSFKPSSGASYFFRRKERPSAN
jgi:hypothetical protein